MILNSVPFASVLLQNFNQIKMVSSLYSPLPFRFVEKNHNSQQFHFTPEFGLKHEKKKNISGFFRHSRFIYLKVHGLPPSIMQLLIKKH